MSSTCFFSLPYELRQHILRLCVRQTGTIELQQPLWAGPGAFSQALFSTCRQLRDEALEAFYKTNAFIWIIEVDGRMTRTDPARYPLPRLRGRSTAICTSVLPWEYPMLLAHLRHVYLNIYLPDPEKEVLWITKLQEDLTRLVFALDHGIRLRTIKLSFTSHNRNARAGLSKQQLNVLRVLTGMKILGEVFVTFRYTCGLLRESIGSLELEKTMSAVRVSI